MSARVGDARSAALVFVLLAWLGAVLVLNGPGHLSVDSLIQIAEGRDGVMRSYNPVFITVVFGKLASLAGTRALVAISALALALALWGLLAAKRPPGGPPPRAPGWPELALLAALLVTPVPLIYPGIVWKDVWFAHACLLGFALIAQRERLPGPVLEGLCIALFAAAMLSRQSGAVVSFVGIVTLAWVRRPGATPGSTIAWRPLLLGIAARVAGLLFLAAVFGALARTAVHSVSAGEASTGFRLLLAFDIAGMIARQSAPDLSLLAAAGIPTEDLIRTARATFSAERIDKLDESLLGYQWRLPFGLVVHQWWSLAVSDPSSYLLHRFDVLAWLFGLREQAACLPVHVGVEPGPLLARAGVAPEGSPYGDDLWKYARRFVGTPYFAPGFWSLVSCGLLARAARRRRADPVRVGLQVAGVAYLAAYFPIAISCDFRYAYFSVLAGMVGLATLPGELRRPAGTPSASA